MERDVVTLLLFAEDVAQDATGLGDIDAGEILFIGVGGTPLNAAAITALNDNDPFWIDEGKKGNNNQHIISPRLTNADITEHSGTSYAAAVQEISMQLVTLSIA